MLWLCVTFLPVSDGVVWCCGGVVGSFVCGDTEVWYAALRAHHAHRAAFNVCLNACVVCGLLVCVHVISGLAFNFEIGKQ